MKPLIAAITILLAFASNASAQMNGQDVLAQIENTHESSLQASTTNAMSFQKVLEVSRAAERARVASALPALAQNMVATQEVGAAKLLYSGHPINMSASAGAGLNPLQQRSIDVHVTYNAYPVGGILNIRVELLPIFGGIGSAVRPTITREFAQAVDDFDDHFVGKTIVKLTDELAAEYAARPSNVVTDYAVK